jgi:hypothetical protein
VKRRLDAALILCAVFAGAASAAPCKPLDALPAPVLDAPFLVFGEVHGTREVPEFVGAYLCAAALQGRKITLAIEFPASEQASIDAFMASQGTAQDNASLSAGAFWRRPLQDGRSSVDMLHLLENIRSLRAGGADIRVVAVDTDLQSRRREAAIAGNLRSTLGRHAGRQVLALIGGLHAIRAKGRRGDPDYESAVYLLADQRPLALTVGTAGGSAWVCRGVTPAACGATPWDINKVDPAPAAPLSLVPPSAQFDGVFYVGATTASPPAIQQD